MCGLFGVIGNNIGKEEVNCFRDLGIISSLRGLDSTGISVVTKAKKNRWNLEYYKDATDPTNFLFYNKKTYNLLYNTKNVFALMGHARAATIGSVIPENAHPHHVGHILGMHNGTINSLGDKNKTDSECLFERIAEKGIQEALNSITGNLAYALTWLDSKTNTINILRNENRPLYGMVAKTGGLMYYASERLFLEIINERATRIFNTPSMIGVDTLFSLKFGETSFEKKEVRRQLAPFFGGFSRKPLDDEIPFHAPTTVGPATVPVHQGVDKTEGPSLTVLNAVEPLCVEYETEIAKFDPCHEVFPQRPVSGYPFKVRLRHPDLPTQFLKILRFNDFYGRYRSPVEIAPLLDQGCIISGIKATVNDTVYWIAPDLYVMPQHKDDTFVKETIAVYDLKQPKMARACYASAIGLHKLAQSIAARNKEQTKVYVN